MASNDSTAPGGLPVSAPADPLANAAPLLSEPVEWPDNVKSYLEQFIQLRLPTASAFATQIAAIAQPVGSSLFLTGVDLTANTGEYVYTHPSTGLTYLYANGATVSQTTYADLFAWFGGHIWAADPGSGNFVLPDTRGRSLWTAGTNAATDVGDNDGISEASRQPKHEHTSSSLTVTGAPTAGTLATGADGAHSHAPSGGGSFIVNDAGNTDVAGGGSYYRTERLAAATDTSATHTHSITGAPAAGTLDVGGTAGSGMAGSDAVAHIVIGSLVIRF